MLKEQGNRTIFGRLLTPRNDELCFDCMVVFWNYLFHSQWENPSPSDLNPFFPGQNQANSTELSVYPFRTITTNLCHTFLSSTFRYRLKPHLSVANKISPTSCGNKKVQFNNYEIYFITGTLSSRRNDLKDTDRKKIQWINFHF